MSALLIAACLFLTGELQTMIVNAEITSFDNLSFRIKNDFTSEISEEELDALKGVLKAAAEKNNAGLFVTSYEQQSNLEETEYFYCAGNAAEYIEETVGGHFTYDSLLTGRLNFKLCQIDELTDTDTTIDVYFCGDEKAVQTAKDYISEYITPSNVPADTFGANIYKIMSMAAFALAAALIMMFTTFDVNVRRKEYVIKCIYGESRLLLIGRYYLTDAAVYLAEITLFTVLLSQLNSLLYGIADVIIFAAMILAGVLLCYIPLFKASSVKALKGEDNTRKILFAGRTMKVMVSALIICVTAVFISLLADLKTYIKTADFFKAHSDYSFCYMAKDDDWETMAFDRENYADNNYTTAYEYYDLCEPLLINREAYLSQSNTFGADGCYIFANANAVDYVKSVVGEFKNTRITADYVVIAPEEIIDDGFIEKNLSEINNRYDICIREDIALYNKDNIQIIKTKKSYDVFATDNSKGTEMGVYKDEPIIICTVPENESPYSPKEMNLGSQNYYMLKIDDSLKNELISKNNYTTFVQTNCKEQFDYFWRLNRLGLIYFGVFTVILLFLEAAVLSFVVRAEFELNKEELCIKKIHGYTVLSRYGEVIAETLITSGICFGVSIFILSWLDTKLPFAAAVVTGIILLAFEFAEIVFYAIRLEKRNAVKILKGGAL